MIQPIRAEEYSTRAFYIEHNFKAPDITEGSLLELTTARSTYATLASGRRPRLTVMRDFEQISATRI